MSVILDLSFRLVINGNDSFWQFFDKMSSFSPACTVWDCIGRLNINQSSLKNVFFTPEFWLHFSYSRYLDLSLRVTINGNGIFWQVLDKMLSFSTACTAWDCMGRLSPNQRSLKKVFVTPEFWLHFSYSQYYDHSFRLVINGNDRFWKVLDNFISFSTACTAWDCIGWLSLNQRSLK